MAGGLDFHKKSSILNMWGLGGLALRREKMEEKMKTIYLVSIQKILRDMARSAVNTDFNMEVDLSENQWNAWSEKDLERVLAGIRKNVELAEDLLAKVKKGE